MAIGKLNHTQISNDFIDQYMDRLSGSATKVFLAISRKTIGWHKDLDYISLTQLEEITGLSRHTVINATEELIKCELIKKTKSKNTNIYEINYFDSAEIIPVKDTQSAENALPECRNYTRTSAKNTHTKESKETHLNNDPFATQKKVLYNTLREYISQESEKLHGECYYHDRAEAGALTQIVKRAFSNGYAGKAKEVCMRKLKILISRMENPQNDFERKLTLTPRTFLGQWNKLAETKPKEVYKRL